MQTAECEAVCQTRAPLAVSQPVALTRAEQGQGSKVRATQSAALGNAGRARPLTAHLRQQQEQCSSCWSGWQRPAELRQASRWQWGQQDECWSGVRPCQQRRQQAAPCSAPATAPVSWVSCGVEYTQQLDCSVECVPSSARHQAGCTARSASQRACCTSQALLQTGRPGSWHKLAFNTAAQRCAGESYLGASVASTACVACSRAHSLHQRQKGQTRLDLLLTSRLQPEKRCSCSALACCNLQSAATGTCRHLTR